VLTGYNKNRREIETRDIPVPEVGTNDVRVKVRTAGVDPLGNRMNDRRRRYDIQ